MLLIGVLLERGLVNRHVSRHEVLLHKHEYHFSASVHVAEGLLFHRRAEASWWWLTFRHHSPGHRGAARGGGLPADLLHLTACWPTLMLEISLTRLQKLSQITRSQHVVCQRPNPVPNQDIGG